MTPTRLNGDRGVSAIIIALSAVVLFGIAAYVVDVGALYTERRELQNGADAAALAVAADCANGDCGDHDATADRYVDDNAHDGAANVGELTFPDSNTVRVVATTADAGADIDANDSTVDFVFGRIFGSNGATVSAAAAARWGTPSGGATLPITFSLCEWDYFMSTGGFVDLPLDGSEGPPHVIYFHTGNNDNDNGNGNGNGANTDPGDCAAQAGQDWDGDTRLPGGFGWLEHDGCALQIEAGGWVPADPGNGPERECLENLVGEVVLIPIFDDASVGNPAPCSGPGGKCYHIYGFAAFYVTGFRFPGEEVNRPCNPPNTCVGGYFTEFVFELPGSGTGGPDLGASIVELVE